MNMTFASNEVTPPLKLRVLDLADAKASFCSKLLADMGAEVIKIEKPGGDSTRFISPFCRNFQHPERSLFFWYNNLNKYSITLDFQKRKGRDILFKLVEKADVVIE